MADTLYRAVLVFVKTTANFLLLYVTVPCEY